MRAGPQGGRLGDRAGRRTARPYLTDEELEGPKLNLALFSAARAAGRDRASSLPALLAGRGRSQAGAVEDFHEIFIERGLDIYEKARSA